MKTVPAVSISSGEEKPQARLGSQVWGNDGRRYIYLQAETAMTPSSKCVAKPTFFAALNSTGNYTSPPTDMLVGDHGWYSYPIPL